MCKIGLDANELDVFILSQDEFYRAMQPFFAKPDFGASIEFEEFVEERRKSEEGLRTALSALWKPNDDFAVGWDTNLAFTMCGGIYSPTVVCREYLEMVFRILQTTKWKERWAYSTAVELDTFGGTFHDFTLRGQSLFVNCDNAGFDFVRCFVRSKADAEAASLNGVDWRRS